jgi:hypothetical protein
MNTNRELTAPPSQAPMRISAPGQRDKPPLRAGRPVATGGAVIIAKSAQRSFRSQPREKRALRRTFRLTMRVQGPQPMPPTAQVILPPCRLGRNR